MNSGYCLEVSNGSILDYTKVAQASQYSSSTSEVTRLRQMWKVKYMGNGSYSIRPLHNAEMGLYWGDNLMVWNIGTSDTVSSVNKNAQWNISWKGTGYVVKQCGDDKTAVMQVSGASKAIGANRIFNATVNCYFDMGYCVRYNLTKEESVVEIESALKDVVKLYESIFGLQIRYTVSYYESEIDKCKGEVTKENLDTECVHTDREMVISDCKYWLDGGDNVTNVYLTGHRITNTVKVKNEDGKIEEEIQVNRSCSSGNTVLLIGINTNDAIRAQKARRGLFHELNHQYGAPDHYHDEIEEDGEMVCRNEGLCSECGTEPTKRPGWCVMGIEEDAKGELLICSGCREGIMFHLINHHE